MDVGFDLKTLRGLTLDSRHVKRDYLFGAFPGSKLDGRDYIRAAIDNGARVILAPIGTVLPDLFSEQDVLLITDENPRLRFAKMAAEFYARQPEYVAAVTGTNGKTSCVHFLRQLWEARDIQAASIGTLGVRGLGDDGNTIRSGAMTTPDPVSLHARLADLASVGVTHLAMEASSHGLDQYRLDGVEVDVAGFTNLSRDHLDYHSDMDEYFAVKSRLFSQLVCDGGAVVLNADIVQFEPLVDIAKARGLEVLSYGRKGETLKLHDVTPHVHGQLLDVEIRGQSYKIELPLVGDFQAMNVLCALGMAIAQDISQVASYVEAAQNLRGAPGRLHYVSSHPRGAAVYVDYAHTPDALETVLKSLRAHTSGRLICVFGCGGSRDAGKRAMMGDCAVRYADHVIVTDDNPRSEDPAKIRADILCGAKGAQEISGRADAINAGVATLKEGDVLLIAGKGHEQGQVFAEHTEEFDDYTQAKKAIEELI